MIPAHRRLHVEEAEDKLVQSTETAIGLMKAVLENVSDMSCPFKAGTPRLRPARAAAEPVEPRQGSAYLLLHRRRDS